MITLDPPDACPSCFPGDCPASLPLTVDEEAGRILASYECSCGTAWETLFDQFGWPIERTTAPVKDAATRRAAA